ncbi:riboflavin kinase [Candidatus Gottesmanbacteria bacterium]|nr:riboflavin kinase [Candidatus Gottesmanbacteria bacterium]
MKKKSWFRGVVLSGQKLGRTLGFPTVNLDPLILTSRHKKGVYACKVRYRNASYQGALFFGPRLILGEKTDVLEIYILDFDKDIYNEVIEFRILNFIRKPTNFINVEALKRQLETDVHLVKKLLNV